MRGRIKIYTVSLQGVINYMVNIAAVSHTVCSPEAFFTNILCIWGHEVTTEAQLKIFMKEDFWHCFRKWQEEWDNVYRECELCISRGIVFYWNKFLKLVSIYHVSGHILHLFLLFEGQTLLNSNHGVGSHVLAELWILQTTSMILKWSRISQGMGVKAWTGVGILLKQR